MNFLRITNTSIVFLPMKWLIDCDYSKYAFLIHRRRRLTWACKLRRRPACLNCQHDLKRFGSWTKRLRQSDICWTSLLDVYKKALTESLRSVFKFSSTKISSSIFPALAITNFIYEQNKLVHHFLNFLLHRIRRLAAELFFVAINTEARETLFWDVAIWECRVVWAPLKRELITLKTL